MCTLMLRGFSKINDREYHQNEHDNVKWYVTYTLNASNSEIDSDRKSKMLRMTVTKGRLFIYIGNMEGYACVCMCVPMCCCTCDM